MINVLVPAGRWWGGSIAKRLYRPPRRTHHRNPAEFGMGFSSNTIQSSDGIDLHLWVIPGTGTGCAIVGHGIGLSKSASLGQAELLHRLGMTVVMFDHRNHGLSGTDKAMDGLADRFTLDVKASVRHGQDITGGSGMTLVWGFSFSCFPSLYLLREADNGVDALICDSGPAASLRPLFDGFFATGILPIPPGLRSGSGRAAMLEEATVAGTAMLGAQWPPQAVLGSLSRTPILLIAGAQDSIVPPNEMRAIAALYPKARYCELDGQHLGTFKNDQARYEMLVQEFVAEAATTY